MFQWLEDRQRRKILDQPFPDSWDAILERNMRHFSLLDDEERQRLRDLVQVFVAEKHWEGCGGLEITEEIQVAIAGMACLLLLGLDHVLYKHVSSILVYPSTVMTRPSEGSSFAVPTVVDQAMPILGEAMLRGPVLLVWDSVKQAGAHPGLGHNVVYHEFAHKLDMLDGSIDGTPPLTTKEEYARWIEVCTREYDNLKHPAPGAKKSLIDPYGATNVGEFFAVATELFFDKPLPMRSHHGELYSALKGFYRQDPAERARRGKP